MSHFHRPLRFTSRTPGKEPLNYSHLTLLRIDDVIKEWPVLVRPWEAFLRSRFEGWRRSLRPWARSPGSTLESDSDSPIDAKRHPVTYTNRIKFDTWQIDFSPLEIMTNKFWQPHYSSYDRVGWYITYLKWTMNTDCWIASNLPIFMGFWPLLDTL